MGMSAEGMLDDPCLFAPATAVAVKSAEANKDVRRIEKKLRQTTVLKDREAAGATLSAEEREKLGKYASLRKERKVLLAKMNLISASPAEENATASRPARASPILKDGLAKVRHYLDL